METITSDDLEVDYLLWEAEDPYDKPCANPANCPNAAVYRVKFGPAEGAEIMDQCLCRNSALMCLKCYDIFSQPGFITCLRCDRFKVIVSSEPIR